MTTLDEKKIPQVSIQHSFYGEEIVRHKAFHVYLDGFIQMRRKRKDFGIDFGWTFMGD
jgi:hypothetical protein